MFKQLMFALLAFVTVPVLTCDSKKTFKTMKFKAPATNNKIASKAGYAYGLYTMITPLSIIAAPLTIPTGLLIMGATATYEYVTREREETVEIPGDETN